MSEALKLLVIEADEADFLVLEHALRRHGMAARCQRVASFKEVSAALQKGDWDAVLIGLDIPGLPFHQTLVTIRTQCPDLPVILVTSAIGEETAVDLLREGVWDVVRKDNPPRLVTAIARALSDAKGRRVGHEQEICYRGIFDSIADAIFIQDETGRILDVNRGAVAMCGYAREFLLGKSPLDLAVPGMNDLEALPGLFREAYDGVEQRCEFWSRRANGEIFPKEVRLVPGNYMGRRAIIAVARDITERKAFDERLRLQEAALESAANTVVITDAEGVIEWVNPAFAKLTGYSRDEAVGRTHGELVRSGEHDQAFYEEMWRTILAGRIWHGEVINRRKDGSLFYEEITITPVSDEDGVIRHYVAVKQDISERKRYEAALRASEERFRTLVDQAADAFFVHDLDGRLLDVNQQACDSLGYTREELLGLAVTEVDIDFDPARARAVWSSLVHGQTTTVSGHHRRKDGTVFPVEVRLRVLDMEGRRLVAGLARDTSERWRAEASLRAERDFVDAVVEAAGAVIVVLDRQGRIVRFNHSAEVATGYRFEELRGQPIWEYLIPPERQADVRAVFDNLVHDRIIGTYENEWLTRAGTRRLFEWRNTVLYDASGRVNHVIAQGYDITERKAAEATIRRDREQQATLRELIEIVLKGDQLEATLGQFLDRLLAISWLTLLPKGGIFLMSEDGGHLRLAVQRQLAQGVLEQCAHLAIGHCLCGQAAATGLPQFADHVDTRHEVTYPGMADHGHYCAPLLLREEVVGVLVLYLPPGFRRDPDREEFIDSVADVLASFIGRKRDERALLDNENLTRSIMDSLGNSIAVLNRHGEIIRVNRAWREFAAANGGGGPIQSGVGLDYLDACATDGAVDSEYAVLAQEGIRGVLEGRQAQFSMEYPCHSPRTPRWFSMNVTPLQDGGGGAVTIHGDITTRKLAELALTEHRRHLEEEVQARTAELRAEEERSRLILESSADGLFGLDAAGCFTFVNPAACQMLGYAMEDLIGLPAHPLIHHTHGNGSVFPTEECPMHQALHQARLMRVEEDVFWCRDGRAVLVEYAATPIRKAERVIGVVVSFRDIAERKRMEHALRESEANLAHAQSIAHVGSWHLDIVNDVLSWSKETYRIHGLAPGTPINLGMQAALIHDDDTERILEAWESALRGRTYDIEYRIVVDGQVRWLREQAEARFDSAGRPVAGIGAVQDISALKAADMATQQALREAKALARAKSEFLANMSHEIRTPLNAVLGLARMGERDNRGRKANALFQRILDSGQHLLTVVNDVLDFSKIEAGKLVVERTPFVLGEVIDQALNLTAWRAYDKNLAFNVREAADLPKRMSGDSIRLVQVLVNLLSNAVKFTEMGKVGLEAWRDATQVYFRVTDTGIGITPEQAKHLFQPFMQADSSTTRRFGGTGLGLAISAHLVAAMGGRLRAESDGRAGSLFELALPLDAAATAAPPGSEGCASARLVGLSEDEADHLTATLREHAVRVERVPAARAFERPLPDRLVISAEALPEIDPETAQGLVPLIVTTPGTHTAPPENWHDRAIVIERPLFARRVIHRPTSHIKHAASTEGRLVGLRILAAEDTEVNRIVLEDILAREGAGVVFAENGLEAVECIQDRGGQAFDGVLMDVQMPVMDGYEATRRIHRLAPRLPVIGLTAHALREEWERCLEAGMLERVTKPIDTDILVSALLRHARPGLQEAEPREEAMAPTATQAIDEPSPPETGASSQAEMIDWPALSMRYSGRQAFIDKLARTALDSQRGTPEKLRRALAEKDFDAIAFIAHSLKGLGGNMMADTLREAASLAEDGARAHDPETLALAGTLAEVMDALLRELAARLGA